MEKEKIMKKEEITSTRISGFESEEELINELQKYTDKDGFILDGYGVYYPDGHFRFPVDLCCNKSRVRMWYDNKTPICLDDEECRKVYIIKL